MFSTTETLPDFKSLKILIAIAPTIAIRLINNPTSSPQYPLKGGSS
ncbi:MAG: hypothetical protein V7K89_10995 [Nostoc sp.]